MDNVIWAGSDWRRLDRDKVGGKGLNLLRLYEHAKKNRSYDVPLFLIIPTDTRRDYEIKESGTMNLTYRDIDIEAGFDKLKKPVAVRSSSPLEDGQNASFAGKFGSCLNIRDFKEMRDAAISIYDTARNEFVRDYADRMDVDFTDSMALIVQEQVTDALEHAIIQLQEDRAIIEFDKRNSHRSISLQYDILDRSYPPDQDIPSDLGIAGRNSISQTDMHHAANCARLAKKELGLEGIVQVEGLLTPGRIPRFVQIRQLPKVRSYTSDIDMRIPDGVPYIESEICNGVAGELVLPAYVTCSQARFFEILISTGQDHAIGLEMMDKRQMEIFEKNSRLSNNHDYQKFKDLTVLERQKPISQLMPMYNKVWDEGNGLYDNYILVCDRLDDTIAAMNTATKNKRAIITCHEISMTSHAMTIARELGIMCMGVKGDIEELEPKFYHQIETGDLIHMKSDGKKAVAYLEKKRDNDPYGWQIRSR